MNIPSIRSLTEGTNQLQHQHVLIRVDFNVPLSDDGTEILDDTRIRETLPTIEFVLRRRGKLLLCSHRRRPKGKPNPEYGLRPNVDRLHVRLDHSSGEQVNVAFAPDCVGGLGRELSSKLEDGKVL